MGDELNKVVERLEKITDRLEKVSSREGTPEAQSSSAMVIEFDELLRGPLSAFMAASGKLGVAEVTEQARTVQTAFEAQRAFLLQTTQCQKPPDDKMVELLRPTSVYIQKVQEIVEANRRGKHFNHLSSIASSISVLAWVTVGSAPAPYIKDTIPAGQFYSNRILKEKKPDEVAWVKSWVALLNDLHAYVKKNCTTGLEWSKTGGQAAAPPSGAPPPPGPPPPPPPAMDDSAGGEDVRAALFADLNKGADITKGLKKVKDEQKTHKNPNMKAHGAVPYHPPTAPKPFQKAAAPKAAAAKPPVCELQGKKWVIENQNEANLTIDAEIKQTVYVFNCTKTTIQVKKKVNSITLDSCKRCAIVFEGCVSAVEFINCQSVKGQVTGQVNTVSIDKTDGCMFYLSKDSLKAEIVSAKSSEMNLLVPDDSGDFKEFAVPEQFKTTWNGKGISTLPADLAL